MHESLRQSSVLADCVPFERRQHEHTSRTTDSAGASELPGPGDGLPVCIPMCDRKRLYGYYNVSRVYPEVYPR